MERMKIIPRIIESRLRRALDRLWVVYPGKMGYPMDDRIECVPLAELSRIRETLQ
jgi:hypothetical protein